MMPKDLYNYQISIIVTVVFTICHGHDADDVKIFLKRYDTDMCLKMEAVNPTEVPRTHTVSLKRCEWQNTTNGMAFSILPLEPLEPVENEEDIPKLADEHLIRISGSSCLITGTDNYSLKTGRCNVRHARYVINHLLPEKRFKTDPTRLNPSLPTNTEASNKNGQQDSRNVNIYAFLFKQGGYCLTDETTTNKGLSSSVMMSPCVQDDLSQMWSICSINGECSEIILRFFNLPLYAAPSVASTEGQSTIQQTESAEKGTTQTFISEMTSETPIESASTPPTKPVSLQTVKPKQCGDHLKSGNYTCHLNSSSLKQLSTIVLFFCVWTLI